MELNTWLTLLLATIAISVSPGAGAVVSMNYGINYGLKKSYAAIFGLQAGLLIQTFDVIVMTGYSSMASRLKFLIKDSKAMKIQNRITGSFLILAAIFMSTTKRT